MRSPDPEPAGTRERSRVIPLLIAFLVGLLPGTIVAWQQHSASKNSQRDVAVYQIRDRSGMSAMYARRGDYDRARTLASSMFRSMRERVDAKEGDEASLQHLRKILAERDDIITLLARNDPAGADRLLSIQQQLVQALPVPD